MPLSLTGLHVRFLIVLLLALGAIGYANYLALGVGTGAASAQHATLLAREIANGIDAQLRAQRLLAQQVATAVNAENFLKLRPAERDRRQHELSTLIPGSEAVFVVGIDGTGAPVPRPDVAPTLLDPLLNAVRTNTIESVRIVLADNKPVGYALFVPLGTNGKLPTGFIITQFSLKAMEALATRAAAGVGYLQITTDRDDLSLLTSGDRALRDDTPPISSTIGKSGWTLLLWPRRPASTPYDLPVREAGIVLVALTFVLLAGFRLWQRSTRNVRHDVMSLLRMFKDVRDGNMRVDYPLRLKDFSDVYQYLRHSGRKMLKEKKRLKTMGLIDHLSQLSNRRHFEMRLKELFELSRTHGPSSVLIIDVDHFKRVNDEHGHDAGDALITGFAKALRHAVRQSDVLVRLGGDEFCVVYPYAALDRAAIYAERLRRQLPREIPLLKGAVHELRWTGGLSMMAENDTKFDEVLWRADQALIQAKEAGRNTLRVFDPDKGLDKKPPMPAN